MRICFAFICYHVSLGLKNFERRILYVGYFLLCDLHASICEDRSLQGLSSELLKFLCDLCLLYWASEEHFRFFFLIFG